MTKIHPGSIDIGGVIHLRNSLGHYVPLDTVPARTQLQDETVRKIVSYAKDLSAEIARFKAHTLADIGEFDALLAQNYGVARPKEVRGNRTLTSFDGNLTVSIKIADQFHFGAELQQAKALLDEMVQERAHNADELLIALVNQAFDVGKEGKVNASSLMALRNLEISDPRWTKVCEAIDDSRKTIGTKQYVTVHERSSLGERHELIPLDLAAVKVGPQTFQQGSLRKANEAAKKALAELLTNAFAGAPGIDMRILVNAAEALGIVVDQADVDQLRRRFLPPTEDAA